MLMTNTKVKFGPGLLAGIIAGTIFSLTQWVYITFQIGVSKYNAIYGSFAALPLFMVWLQISWLIILFGAELAFAYQNVETYEFEPVYTNISPRLKKLGALQIAHLLVKRFGLGKPALNALEISRSLKMPIRLVEELLGELEHSGVVSKVYHEEHQHPKYQPASDINLWTVNFVTSAMENRGLNKIPAGYSEELEAIEAALENMDDAVKASAGNVLLKNI